MTRRLALAMVCAVLALSCATQPPLPATDLSAIESLGLEIYSQDRASWVATDAALAAGLKQTGAKGWITEPSSQGWRVRFVGPCGDSICSFIDVVARPDAQPIVTKHDPPDPLLEDSVAQWKARELALNSGFRRCTKTYNTVVLHESLEGTAVWVVYLLAASTEPSDIVLTGHHRITVNDAGTEILRNEPLSLSCIVTQKDERATALTVSHVIDDHPIETHVFTNLFYGIPLYVSTKEGMFAIEKGKIHRAK